MTLTFCTDLTPASWIADSDLPWDKLVRFGPSGFPAYARLRFIPDPTHEGQRESDIDRGPEAPSDAVQLRAVLDILGRYTCTPDQCYFCLWDGWASDIHGSDGGVTVDRVAGAPRPGHRIEPAFPPSVLDGPKVQVPARAYYLFQGELADFGDWGAADLWPGRPRLDMPEPAFIWPADHAWCVTNDVDPHWAGIGAGTSAIDDLVANAGLDVVVADPDGDLPHYL